MDEEGARTDAVIARIAARQHGVVAYWQLRAAGISKDSVWKAARARRLHRIHHGIYAVGHRGLSDEGRWMAAVLACGKGSVLSHWDGAALLELLPVRSGFVDVTVRTAAGRRRRPGIRIHRCPSLTDDEVTQQKRIPVTTPARTIKDLRRTASAAVVRRAIRNAEFRDLPLGTVSTDRTRSELERKLLAICRRHPVPSPEVNVPVGPYTVDFLWRELRLVVEVDGYRAHRGRQAFEDDRERDRRLALLGCRVLRFTYRQVTEDPAGVAEAIRVALAPS